MTLKARLLASLLALAVVTIGCIVSYRWYDKHHISSDLRRTLSAACNESASVNDVRSYIRDARLQIRTGEDAKLLSEFEEVMSLRDTVDAIVNNPAIEESTASRLGPGSSFQQLIDIKARYVELGSPVPKDVENTLNKILSDEKTRIEDHGREVENNLRIIGQNDTRIATLMRDIKIQLSLIPSNSGM